jgi:hypothetical protein
MCVPKYGREVYEAFATKYSYEPDTGVFRFRENTYNNVHKAGDIAGSVRSSDGYIQLTAKVDGKSVGVLAHRLAWFMTYDEIPNVVDHIVTGREGRSDNRISNLRNVSQRENTTRSHIKSSSKYVGVTWHKAMQKWQSQIKYKGKQLYLGLFDTEEEAAQAYKDALDDLNLS